MAGFRSIISRVFRGADSPERASSSVRSLGATDNSQAQPTSSTVSRLGARETQIVPGEEWLEHVESEDARRAWESVRDDVIGDRPPAEPPLGGPGDGGNAHWIGVASSWVDAFYWQPYDPRDGSIGRLYMAFRTSKRSTRRIEGYYDQIRGSQFADFIAAWSKGEWVSDNLYKQVTYHKVGTGTCIGLPLPWPRPGSRGTPEQGRRAFGFWSTGGGKGFRLPTVTTTHHSSRQGRSGGTT